MPLITYSMLVLVGICLYAGLHFLIHYIRRYTSIIPDSLYLLFALMCFATLGQLSTELIAYQAHSAERYVQAFKWRDVSAGLFLALWPWFVYRYTNTGQRGWVFGMSCYFALLILASVSRPYGGLFDTLPELTIMALPWGEQISISTDTKMNWFGLLSLSGIAVLVFYTCYASIRQYRRGQRQQAMLLGIAMAVFSALLFIHFFARAGLYDSIFVGQYSFPALIIVTGISLHRQLHGYMERVQSSGITQQKILHTKYQSLFEYANDVILLIDAKSGKILDANPAASKLYGYPHYELLTMTIHDLCSQQTVEQVSGILERLYQQDTMVFEREHRSSDGRIFPVEVSSRLLELDSKPVFLNLVRDISERKKIETALRQSEQRLAEAQRVAHIGHWELDLVANELVWSEEIYRMFGIDPNTHAASYELFLSSIHPDDRERVNKAYTDSVKNHTPYTIEHRLWLPDGSIKYVQERCKTYYDHAGNPLRSIGTVQDITDRRRHDEAIRNIAAGVSAQSGDAFFQQLVQHLGKIFTAKYAFVGLLDENNSNQLNTLAISVDGEIADNVSYLLEDTPCANVITDQTCTYPDGVQALFPKDYLLRDMGVEGYIGTRLFDAQRKPIGLIAVLDVKPLDNVDQIKPVLEIFAARASAELERVQAENYIRRLAYEDYLTGLGNRAALHEHMNSVLEHSGADKLSGAMLLIDLDHFKTINDALSHDIGDHVLQLVGQRLRDTAGESVYLARIGGDEFVAVLTGDSESDNAQIEDRAYSLAVNIVLALEAPFVLDERILNIGASIGLVLFPQHADNEPDILRRADMALYRAKNQGRGNVQVYQSDLQELANERLQIERGLRHAIEHNELSLHFQPQVDAHGEILGAEVLLRWQHSELGSVSPVRFIPVAEETGLIHSIGAWVLDVACQRIRAWQEANQLYQLYLAINVSAWQFANTNFVSQVLDVLNRYNVDPHNIVLELTETALLYDVDETIVKLKTLQDAGLRIALDDFGTGYSSLAYLKDIPIDILKIDKAFIAELTQTSDHPLVETIIAMGQHMNLHVIAEGVETEAQHKILLELGCAVFQGFHFCRPLPEPEFMKWLSKKTRKMGNQQHAG